MTKKVEVVDPTTNDVEPTKSSTEVLRALLDERGVPWKDYGYENHTWWGEWHAENRASVNGLFLKVEGVVTPEQAVEATLGRVTCHKVRVHMQIEDEMHCSECGRFLGFAGDVCAPPYNFCPNCGAKVVDE